jgi:non-specific serine/threonine protein kinase
MLLTLSSSSKSSWVDGAAHQAYCYAESMMQAEIPIESEPDSTEIEFRAAVTPKGHLQLLPGSSDFKLAPAAARRIRSAYAASQGALLLHLGSTELSTELPADLAFFRELCRRFLTALCAIPELEEQRQLLAVPPPVDLAELAGSVPPMLGAEYVNGEVLAALWADLQATVREELRDFAGTAAQYLQAKNPLWNRVGRVCFHLVENKRDPEAPFAFLATYSHRISSQDKVAHLPLGKALSEYAEAANKGALLNLLLPVQKAASKSSFLKQLVDSGEIFAPLTFTPQEAYEFLKDLAIFEESGVVVRVPDFWQARRPPRPQVTVTVGKHAAATLGAEALLDFSVSLTLGGQTLTAKEWQEILRGTDGLVLIKGRWVEVERDKLRAALGTWQAAQKAADQGGLSFIEAMRLVSGAAVTEKDDAVLEATTGEWSAVVAGDFLAQVLQGLRHPQGLGAADPGPELLATLRPYQQVGLKWLYLLDQLGLGACLADDMGLGKTLQVLALLLLKRKARTGRAKHGKPAPSLLVAPASLLGNWQAELRRFAPSLRTLVAHPSAFASAELSQLGPADVGEVDLCMTSYGSVHRFALFTQVGWDLLVLDEAQAIKNPAAKQTRAVKSLRSRTRLALSGTPVENRLSDLWSIFDFVCPGLLGSAKVFSRFAKRLAETQNYGPLRNLVHPYLLRRLKSDKSIIADLPDKTELFAYCSLSKKQAVLYQEAVDALAVQLSEVEPGMQRRGLILSFLLRLKQICNHPSQHLGDGDYAPADSGKFARLAELCEPIASRQEKVLVFTQFRELTGPLADFLRQVFGRPGLVLHGDTPVPQRMALVDAFAEESGPPFFVLSLKAGGTGLNLTAASHVIHFDRWWNPAVEAQASDRAYRIGQKKNVLIHKFVCRGTVEEKIDALIEAKKDLSQQLLAGGGDALLTEMNNEELLRLVSLDISHALAGD